jgi:hypothetical protein
MAASTHASPHSCCTLSAATPTSASSTSLPNLQGCSTAQRAQGMAPQRTQLSDV